MSLKHSLTRIVALTATLLAACGDEVTEVTEVHETGMKIVEKGEKLPKCTTENEGTMVYALDSAAAYLCINRDWTSFNGKDGADGKDGRDGKDGEDGAKGDKGDQGEQGVKGDAGEKGDTGEQGPKGDKGDDGNDGKDGQDGKSIEGAENFFIDARDKQIYKKVTIGTQTWMAENLNFETDGSRCYNDSAKYCAKYGRYYTWADAMDSATVFSDNAKGCGYDVECTIKTPARGICPEGWHIPDTTEWKMLYTAMGESSYAMQAKGFEKWPDATDEFGFSAYPLCDNVFDRSCNDGSAAYFWSATEYNEFFASYWNLRANNAAINSNSKSDNAKNGGAAVRCIKDSAE
jgi:uncharacterized protein (TIGR02145 family)